MMTTDAWRSKTFYQIYPMTFADSNGDGMGDLQGVISKLDYLVDLGIGYLWLTPIYVSPCYDNGYDIADYRAIDPKFGTMSDFEELLSAAHDRGLGVIMDMVVNHTSTEHRWFKEALSDPTSPYRDYYIWRDPVDGGAPNNWRSKFGGSAWELDSASGQYYLHLYEVHQADLNWENPRVREEVIDIMLFWAQKGVDGFRLDVINNISKDQRFLDDTFETPAHDGRTYYSDGPRVHEYLHLLNKRVFEPYGLITVGELSSTTPENVVRYTSPACEELCMGFTFHHMKVDYAGGVKWTPAGYRLTDLKRAIATWQNAMYEGGGWNALFWSNHDQPRAISRFLSDLEEYREVSAKNLAIVEFGLGGSTFVYQGEEVAMRNPHFSSIDEFEDVESINAYRDLVRNGMGGREAFDIICAKSRENCRVPMRWDDSTWHGFSAVRPWFCEPTGDDYPANVERSRADQSSAWYTYKRLIALREEMAVLVNGNFALIAPEDERVFAYKRELGESRALVIANFAGETVEFSCDELKAYDWKICESTHNRLSIPSHLDLAPYEAMLLSC